MGSRQFKEGLDFFYFDTDFFTNDKMQLIEAEFGVKGTIVALRLLCKIYSDKGYYYQWGGDECLLFSKMAGAEFVPSAVKEIVDGLVRRRFFDKGCFDRFAILTSKSIQEIYIQATERRKNITFIKEYLLIDFAKIPSNVNIISLNVNIIPQNDDKKRQSKVKESKVEESKGKKSNNEGVNAGEQVALSPPDKMDLRFANFAKFQFWILQNTPQVAKMKEPFTIYQFEKIKQDYDLDTITNTLKAMHNYAPLLTKSRSANLTLRKWIDKDKKNRVSSVSTSVGHKLQPTSDEQTEKALQKFRKNE